MSPGPRYELATAAEIRALFDRTTAMFDRLSDASWTRRFIGKRGDVRRTLRLLAESYRFCAVAAGALRDPSLGDMVLDVLEELQHIDDYPKGSMTCALQALESLLAAGLPADARVRDLAKSDATSVRQAVAQGLLPRGPAERDLLRKLAADPVPSVRKAAQASLASGGELPWWLGKWTTDPGVRLLPEEVTTAGPALRRASELLDLPARSLLASGEDAPLPELLDCLRELPDALAVEPLEKLWTSLDSHEEGAAFPLLLHLLERDGGIDAFLRVIDAWGDQEHASLRQITLEQRLPEAPVEVRRALSRRLLTWLVESPTTEAWEESRRLAACFLAATWPAGEDITPVLDEVLRLGAETADDPYHVDMVRGTLAQTFKRDGIDPTPVLDRLCEARLAGYPAPWQNLAHFVDPLLGRGPIDVLRRTAERAVHAENPSTIRWGAAMLLDDAFDPEKDGAHVDRARALMTDPRLRAAMIEDADLADRGIAFLRAELRAGALPYPDAVDTFQSIDRLYGGLAEGKRPRSYEAPPTKEAIETKRRAAREAVEPFLGPPDLHGPPTPAEWSALRQARAAYEAPSAEKAAELWSHTLEAGPWTAEEQQDFEAYVALLRAGNADLAYALGSAIVSKPTAEHVLRLDEIIAGAGEHTRPLLKSWRRELRAIHGLPPVARRRRDGGAAPEDGDDLPAGEWADDDDGDDGDDDDGDE